jgi:hypothetical protein
LAALRRVFHARQLNCDELGAAGGGLYAEGVVDLIGVAAIEDNTVTLGGGVYNEDLLTLKGFSRITANTATDTGGGIYNTSSG